MIRLIPNGESGMQWVMPYKHTSYTWELSNTPERLLKRGPRTRGDPRNPSTGEAHPSGERP
eukprot:5599909-Alexandrium_andersonii.AAC.1